MGYSVRDLRRSKSPDHAVAINLAADTVLSPPARYIYVGGVGNVKVDTEGGETGVVFTAVPTGGYVYVNVIKVYSTANGTTATNLVAGYDT